MQIPQLFQKGSSWHMLLRSWCGWHHVTHLIHLFLVTPLFCPMFHSIPFSSLDFISIGVNIQQNICQSEEINQTMVIWFPVTSKCSCDVRETWIKFFWPRECKSTANLWHLRLKRYHSNHSLRRISWVTWCHQPTHFLSSSHAQYQPTLPLWWKWTHYLASSRMRTRN